MLSFRLLVACAAAILVSGCSKPGSQLVGTWTGSTNDKTNGGMQVTVTFKPDGAEKVTTVIIGQNLDPRPPIDSVGTYSATDQTLVQRLDSHYPDGEALKLDPAAPGGAQQITATWSIDEPKLTLSQPGILSPCKLTRLQ